MVVFILVYHPEHDFCNIRIKLTALALLHLIAHYLLWQGVSVASVGCHGIIAVRHRYNPCTPWYIFSLQPTWISCSIVPLVVILCAHRQFRKCIYILENMVSIYTVKLYHGELFIRKSSRLVDYVVRNTYLAHIMEQCYLIYLVLLLDRSAHPLHQLTTVSGNTHRMTFCVFVLCIYRLGKCLHDHIIQVCEFVICLIELAHDCIRTILGSGTEEHYNYI